MMPPARCSNSKRFLPLLLSLVLLGGMVFSGCSQASGPENPDVFTVTFNAQGGTVNPLNATVSSGGTLTKLPVPVKSGNTFAGWFTGANGGGSPFTSATPVTGNITVYAYWTQDTAKTLTVTDLPATPSYFGVMLSKAADLASYLDIAAIGGDPPDLAEINGSTASVNIRFYDTQNDIVGDPWTGNGDYYVYIGTSESAPPTHRSKLPVTFSNASNGNVECSYNDFESFSYKTLYYDNGGTQDNYLTPGTAGSVTYDITTNFSPINSSVELLWYNDLHAAIPTSNPPGILSGAVSVSGGPSSYTGTLTLTVNSSTVKGTYYFRPVIDGARFDIAELAIGRPVIPGGNYEVRSNAASVTGSPRDLHFDTGTKVLSYWDSSKKTVTLNTQEDGFLIYILSKLSPTDVIKFETNRVSYIEKNSTGTWSLEFSGDMSVLLWGYFGIKNNDSSNSIGISGTPPGELELYGNISDSAAFIIPAGKTLTIKRGYSLSINFSGGLTIENGASLILESDPGNNRGARLQGSDGKLYAGKSVFDFGGTSAFSGSDNKGWRAIGSGGLSITAGNSAAAISSNGAALTAFTNVTPLTKPITITQESGGTAPLAIKNTTLDLGGNGTAELARIVLKGASGNPGQLEIQYGPNGGKAVKTGLTADSEGTLGESGYSITGITVQNDNPTNSPGKIGKDAAGKLAHLFAGADSTRLTADSTDRTISSATAVN